jgi:hypothetical protein
MIRRGDTSHGHTQPSGRNLCAIQEIRPEEANRYEEVEEKDEEGGDNLRRIVAFGVAGGDCEGQHARGHSRAAKHEELPPSKAVDGKKGNEAREELPGQRAAGEGTRGFSVEAETLLEDDLIDRLACELHVTGRDAHG